MEQLHSYLDSLVKGRFFGSVKISFEDGIPVLIKEEKAVDVAPFKEEIRRIRRRDSFSAE